MSSAAYPSDFIREFVIAAHFNLEKVQSMLMEYPDLLHVRFEWGPGDYEDALGAASHVGHKTIAEHLLEQGAALTICAAAMLGRVQDMADFIDHDATQVNARGAHGIPVMFHAAMSGETAAADLLKRQGCTEGYDFALHGAVMHGRTSMVAWLLDNGASELNIKNYQGKTPLAAAQEAGHDTIVTLLRERSAAE